MKISIPEELSSLGHFKIYFCDSSFIDNLVWEVLSILKTRMEERHLNSCIEVASKEKKGR